MNSIGQRIFQKRHSLNKAGTINIKWSKKPGSGSYFLKVVDLKNNAEQIESIVKINGLFKKRAASFWPRSVIIE